MVGASWTGNRWTAQGPRDVQITSERLAKLRDFYVSDPDLAGRMSELLWFDIFALGEFNGISVPEFLQSIQDVEAGETASSGVKPATMFRNPPLAGLWHKHYFAAQFLVNNLLLGLGKNGLAKMVDEVFDNGQPRVTEEMISELARRVSHEPVDNREKSRKLTGEWIVFAKHQGKNYYLCCSKHDAGDQAILDRIMQFCSRDFPDLAAWIAVEAATLAAPSVAPPPASRSGS